MIWRFGVLTFVVILCFLLSAPARADWDVVDCSKSEVAIPGATKCWHGPTDRGGSGQCVFEQYSTFHAGQAGAPVGLRARFYVMSYVNHGRGCWVAKLEHDQGLLRTTGDYIAKGCENWSAIRDFMSGYVATCTADGRECMTFVQYGPPYAGGYDYLIRGHYCLGKGDRVSDSELEAAIKSIQISR